MPIITTEKIHCSSGGIEDCVRIDSYLNLQVYAKGV